MAEDFIHDMSTDNSEEIAEQTLRPKSLQQYIGQADLKQRLQVYIQAAQQRSEPLDHMLLYGPPGLGKTTLAMVVANEMGVGLRTTSGPAIEKSGDLLALLNELAPGDVLFIDEIHTLIGAGAAEGAIDAANILKPSLARGELQVIGATTIEEYRQYAAGYKEALQKNQHEKEGIK